MAAALFTGDSHAQVRAALDLRLTPANLPDETIEQPIFIDEATEAVLVADPNAATYTEGSQALKRVRRATSYLVAALLCPVVPNLTQLQLGDTRINWKEWDALARAAQLRGLAAAALALNTEPDGLLPFGTSFTTAHGYRGR